MSNLHNMLEAQVSTIHTPNFKTMHIFDVFIVLYIKSYDVIGWACNNWEFYMLKKLTYVWNPEEILSRETVFFMQKYCLQYLTLFDLTLALPLSKVNFDYGIGSSNQ